MRPQLDLPSHEFLVQLVRDDPGAYEALRTALIDDLIDGAPEEVKRRLRGLQFRIDCMRQLSSSPMGATLKVYHLMWESFYRLNDEMSGFSTVDRKPADRAGAQVIEFRPRPN